MGHLLYLQSIIQYKPNYINFNNIFTNNIEIISVIECLIIELVFLESYWILRNSLVKLPNSTTRIINIPYIKLIPVIKLTIIILQYLKKYNVFNKSTLWIIVQDNRLI